MVGVKDRLSGSVPGRCKSDAEQRLSHASPIARSLEAAHGEQEWPLYISTSGFLRNTSPVQEFRDALAGKNCRAPL